MKCLAVILLAGLLSVGQVLAPVLTVDAEQIYSSATVPIQVTGTGLSPSFRIVLDGTELPTTFVSFIVLSAPWPRGSLDGEYDVMVWDTYNHAVRSNHVSLILGHARRTTICAGGLLSQSASVQTILDYEARYDTRNCRYLQPPRCYTGAPTTARCTH